MIETEKILINSGLIKTVPSHSHSPNPWYIRVLLAISGWLAALFLFSSIGIGLVDIFDEPLLSSLLGGGLIFFAYWLVKKKGNEFTTHLAFAMSLAGQLLILVALADLADPDTSLFWVGALSLFTALTFLIPNYVHRIACGFCSASSLYICIGLAGLEPLGAPILFAVALLFRHSEFYWDHHIRVAQALSYGFIFALFTAISLPTIFHFNLINEISGSYSTSIFNAFYPYILSTIAFLSCVYLQRKQGPTSSQTVNFLITFTAFVVLFGSATIDGLAIGLTFLILGFAHSSSALCSFSIIYLLFSISAYYYQLETSLLSKSASLAIFGIIALVARWVWLKLLAPEEGRS